MQPSERIRRLIAASGLSYYELEKRTGISKSTLQRYATGTTKKLPMGVVEKIAPVLGTTAAYLLGWNEDNEEYTSVVEIRFLGDIAAGFNYQAIEEYETMTIPAEWIRGSSPENYFAMRVIGTSMYPEYRDGDEILCRKCDDLGRSGLVGVFICPDGEATLKRINYVQGEDWVELEPINPEYAPHKIEGYALEQCKVIGKAVRLIRTIEP